MQDRRNSRYLIVASVTALTFLACSDDDATVGSVGAAGASSLGGLGGVAGGASFGGATGKGGATGGVGGGAGAGPGGSAGAAGVGGSGGASAGGPGGFAGASAGVAGASGSGGASGSSSGAAGASGGSSSGAAGASGGSSGGSAGASGTSAAGQGGTTGALGFFAAESELRWADCVANLLLARLPAAPGCARQVGGTLEDADDLDTGRMVFDEAVAQSQLAAFAAAKTEADFEAYLAARAAQKTHRGTLPSGAACSRLRQCEHATCVSTTTCGLGRCGKQVALGEACSTLEICGPDAQCSATSGKCEPLVPFDPRVCDNSYPCFFLQSSDGTCDLATKQCRPQRPIGAACTGDRACGTRYCAPTGGGQGGQGGQGGAPASTAGFCAARKATEICGATYQCEAGHVCLAPPGADAARCVPTPAGFCDYLDSYSANGCLLDGTCAPHPTEPRLCPFGRHCTPNYACVDDAEPALGEGCVDARCASDLVCTPAPAGSFGGASSSPSELCTNSRREGLPCAHGLCDTGACVADVCVPFRQLGASCVDVPCDPREGLKCEAGSCVATALPGAPCGAPATSCGDGGPCPDRCDELHFCGPASTCVPRLALGEPCVSGRVCASGRCETVCVPAKVDCN